MRTFADIKDMDKEQLLALLGLETRRGRLGQWLGCFTAGLVVGAGAVLLLTPASRRTLVSTVNERLKGLRERQGRNHAPSAQHQPSQAAAAS